MQTFLPYEDFERSARVLDWQRLGKQRIETKQIVYALIDPNYGWQNHPAVKMWRGCMGALVEYGRVICLEWRRRGYNDAQLPFFEERAEEVVMPRWMGDEAFHLSHRSNLVRKLPGHYGKIWPDVPNDLEYVWPR